MTNHIAGGAQTASPLNLRSQSGFSMGELMVAMVLTLLVSAGALAALQDANRATEAASTMSDVNQNLRVAMNMLIRDLMAAGEGIPTGGISIPKGGDDVVRPGPEDSDWGFEEEWGTLPAISPGNAIGPIISTVTTDAVTILYADRRVDFSAIRVTNIANDGSSFTVPNTVPINDPRTGIQEGDLIMLSNGNGTALQEVTRVEGQQVFFEPSAASNLNQPDAPEGSVVDIQNDDPNNLWPPTSITRVNMITYYLKVPDNEAITSPHLIRRVNYGDEERVVAIGINNLQLTWDLVDGVTDPAGIENPGVDNQGNPTDNTEHQIRKANITMTARSLVTYSQTGQHVFSNLSTNVSLRSLAFVSRYDIVQ